MGLLFLFELALVPGLVVVIMVIITLIVTVIRVFQEVSGTLHHLPIVHLLLFQSPCQLLARTPASMLPLFKLSSIIYPIDQHLVSYSIYLLSVSVSTVLSRI